MAALALVGAVMTGCSSDDDIIDTPQQPENKSNVVTLTTTIGFDGGATTRALDPATGIKTFAKNDQIAVIYKNTSNETVKAVSEKLTDGDLIDGGLSANFMVTLTDPKREGNVTYIYPAAMAGETGVDLTKLNTQEGTFEALQSKYDLCTKSGAWNAGNLPSLTLENQLAILAITLKHNATSSPVEINNTITGLTVSDGTNLYTVSRSAVAGPIYVAIQPTIDADIDVTATDETNNYVKYLTRKTYEKNKGYPVAWTMTIPGKFTVGESAGIPNRVEFATSNLQATYDGSSWTWDFAANPWDRIGNAAGNTSITANGVSEDNVTVDLFGWVGESSSFNGAASQYGITNATSGYGNNATEALKYDWGNFFVGGWRTPTKDEWTYVFSTRKSGSIVNSQTDARYTYATVNGVHGVILFPDGVKIASGEVTTWGAINDRSDWATQPTTAQWATLAAKGCVFLPAAGYRNGATVKNVNEGGYYWSSTSVSDKAAQAYSVFLKSNNQGFAAADDRFYGFSVRLVKDAE